MSVFEISRFDSITKLSQFAHKVPPKLLISQSKFSDPRKFIPRKFTFGNISSLR